jgi:hypothetical protein
MGVTAQPIVAHGIPVFSERQFDLADEVPLQCLFGTVSA